MGRHTYPETMDFIKNLTKFGINLGLGRIQSLLERMGNPHHNLRIIHVGGTNGKGSTTAMLQSILQQAGYEAGMFISPHLHDYRERISINGELISETEIIRGIEKMRPILEEMVKAGEEHPTEFEVSTALALYYFAQREPNFVILEVGLGGEIDSTNVVTPLITVLTPIGMDHMDYLGETIEEITRVKAGIIKDSVPVITSVNRAQSLKIIEEYAKKSKTTLIKVGQDVHWQTAAGHGVNTFSYYGLNTDYLNLEVALYGEHQFQNASTALAVCEILQAHYGTAIPEKAIREGLRRVHWPGRLELLTHEPKILLDGAHNADGMAALVKALNEYAEGPLRRERLILCLGMLQDKEIQKAVELIAPLADELIITKPDSPRAGNWKLLGQYAEKYLDSANIHYVEDPVQAAEDGLKRLNPGDLFCITGSLYMIAPLREYLLNQHQPTGCNSNPRPPGFCPKT